MVGTKAMRRPSRRRERESFCMLLTSLMISIITRDS